ncbi:MAG: DUF5916 domain-containing protein [Chitinophagaceae bacterium]
MEAQDRFELSLLARARSKRIPQKILKIARASSKIEMDGILNEPAWENAEKAYEFQQQFPNDTEKAITKTEVMLTYDAHNIYAGITCYDELTTKNYVVESLRRDFYDGNNDYLMMIIDPFDNLTTGYVFAITPYGVQLEGLLAGGGRSVSNSWDNIWFSKVNKNELGWTAEFKIPFKSIRYNDDIANWNIQFIRNDLKRNERSTWTNVAQQNRPTSLSYSGGLKWDSTPPPAGSNISIIPYLSGSAFQDFSINNSISKKGKAGFDGKVALSSAVNLDLTVNPDFSTVDVDQQQTNVTRFELFFPERRQFFQENSDLFSDFGFRRSQVFFSRRIGLNSPLQFGTRLSGEVGDGLRVGLLNAQTAHQKLDQEDDQPAYNFTVATFRKQVFGRSSIGGIFTNKQAINFGKDENKGYQFGSRNRYNRVYGLQYNLLSRNDTWTGNFYTFHSEDPVNNSGNWSHGSSIRYNTRKLNASWTHELIGENFIAEMGFFPRTGYFNFGPSVNYRFYPQSKTINRHGPNFRFGEYLDKKWKQTDREIALGYGIDFINSSEIDLQFQDTYIRLFSDFDPTRKSNTDSTIVPLPNGSDYNWKEFNVSYRSNSRKDFYFDSEFGYGGFYNGTRLNFSGRVRFRVRPVFNMSFSYTFNKIDLPDPYPDASFWLIGPRIDFTFTDKVFWTTYIQYNQQADNVNINSRLQWRFAPVSDLFLVYSENYLPAGLSTKNRSVIMKISYWINI